MAYDVGTKFIFNKRAADQRQPRLYSVGTRIVFVKALNDFTESLKVATPQAA
jgi:hypothetical protein